MQNKITFLLKVFSRPQISWYNLSCPLPIHIHPPNIFDNKENGSYSNIAKMKIFLNVIITVSQIPTQGMWVLFHHLQVFLTKFSDHFSLSSAEQCAYYVTHYMYIYLYNHCISRASFRGQGDIWFLLGGGGPPPPAPPVPPPLGVAYRPFSKVSACE